MTDPYPFWSTLIYALLQKELGKMTGGRTNWTILIQLLMLIKNIDALNGRVYKEDLKSMFIKFEAKWEAINKFQACL